MTHMAVDDLLQMVRSGQIDASRITVDGVRGEKGLALLGTDKPEKAPAETSNPFVKAQRGRRPDLGNIFFRSKWEANVARYLTFIGCRWEYETKTFEFPIKHGITRYKPDFHLLDQGEYWEVKGYLDAPSKTKLKRMAKYFPDVKVRLITKTEYNEFKKWARLIPGWEE
jgi:hypothetical protein